MQNSEKGQKRVRAVTLADYKKYSKEKQAKISSRRVTVISDSDDDFESPPKLLRTSDINAASPSPSYSPIHQPEALQNQSVHAPCSVRFASFEYRLAKVEADLAESEQFSCILKDKEKEIELVRALKTKLEEETRQVFKCLICNITTTLPLAISPCCKIVLGCNTCVERWLDEEGTCPHCRQQLAQTGCAQLPVIPSLVELLDKLRE